MSEKDAAPERPGKRASQKRPSPGENDDERDLPESVREALASLQRLGGSTGDLADKPVYTYPKRGLPRDRGNIGARLRALAAAGVPLQGLIEDLRKRKITAKQFALIERALSQASGPSKEAKQIEQHKALPAPKSHSTSKRTAPQVVAPPSRYRSRDELPDPEKPASHRVNRRKGGRFQLSMDLEEWYRDALDQMARGLDCNRIDIVRLAVSTLAEEQGLEIPEEIKARIAHLKR